MLQIVRRCGRALNSGIVFRSVQTLEGPILLRDFIHDSLYSREVGYFERNVNILKPTPGTDIPFEQLKDEQDYLSKVHRLYQTNIHQFGNSAASRSSSSPKIDAAERDLYQLWHTPSTLFRPYYGRAIGQCILCKWDGCSPIVVYEVGPGNGSLSEDILQYFKDEIPDVMPRVEYNLVEISKYQSDNILVGVQGKYPENIKIHNLSFLDWSVTETRKAFVLAMEVFDNLTHDVLSLSDESSDHGFYVGISQGMVVATSRLHSAIGNCNQSRSPKYEEFFIPVEDPLISELMTCMDSLGHKWFAQKGKNKILDAVLNIWPFKLFQTAGVEKEFIPTGAYLFIKTLINKFPQHCFIMSDFDYLPPTVSGFNGPIVQTRYKGKTVGSSTYLLQKGLCDIFFATDFELISGIYKHLYNQKPKNLLSCHPKNMEVHIAEDTISAVVLKHRDFCLQYADHKALQTSSGYNPILDDFLNVSFMIGESSNFKHSS